MPTFKCTYRDGQGKFITDIKSARDSNTIKKEFRQKKYYLISIEDISSARPRTFQYVFFLKSKEVAVFTRQLSNLLSSGMDLSRALGLLGRHNKHPLMKNVSLQIKDKVDGGGHFWEGLSAFPKIFSSLYVGMVKAGETSGHLENVVRHLADYAEEQKDIKDTLIAMAVYPVFLFFVGAAVLFFIMGFVFPRMFFIFDGMQGRSLPLVTQMLIGISTFLSVNGWLMALFALAVVAAIAQSLKDPAVRLVGHSWIYRSPVIGNVIRKMIFVRFTQVLGMVLSNGVPMVEALEIAANVVGNSYVSRKLAMVKRGVLQGSSLSQSLAAEELFSPLMVQVIAVGEETGSLDKTLTDVSLSYDREAKAEMKQLMNLLEPTVILIIALGVGFIVSAILLPIFQMNLMSL